MVPPSAVGIADPSSQNKYRTVNDYLEKQLKANGIKVKPKERVPDEVTYAIRELQKELVSTKAINIGNFKRLAEILKGQTEAECPQIERLRKGKELDKRWNIYKNAMKKKIKQREQEEQRNL